MVFLGFVGLFLIAFAGVLLFRNANDHENNKIYPIKIKLAVYENVTIERGNSRVV
jgi:hypothetical protein